MRATLRRLAPLLGEAPVTVVVAPDVPLVAADAVFLDTVMSNLVENGARHAPGAALEVRIEPAAEGESVAVTVADAGPGVPDDALGNLFDKFYRVPRRGEGPRRGLGLGLSVVRGLVEAMGGSVWAGRSHRGGLAVRLQLPGAAAPAEPSAPEPRPESPAVAPAPTEAEALP